MQGGGGMLVGKSKILNMSNNVCHQTTRGHIDWSDKSLWPTKYYNFNWLVTEQSVTTLHWRGKRNWSAIKLICPC